MNSKSLLQYISTALYLISAALWFWAARIKVPNEIVLTVDGGGWQPITTSMARQSNINGWAALLAAFASILQGLSLILPD